MERLLSSLSPSFFAILKRNIESQLQDSLLFPKCTQMLSNLPPNLLTHKRTIEDVYDILTKNPNIKQVTIRSYVSEFSDKPILSLWKKKFPFIVSEEPDVMYMSYYLPVESDGNVYEIHKQSNQWWRRFINKPLNLKQRIEPESCQIYYHPTLLDTSESCQESYVVEKTWLESFSYGPAEIPKSIICNAKSNNSCFYTFLVDSFSSVENYEFLMLHHKFVPIQTSVVVSKNLGIFIDFFKDWKAT